MSRAAAPDRERDRILAAVPPSVGQRLVLFAELLARWQPTINLVANSTLPDLWRRHIADSLQVAKAAPEARRWVDLGSGGGFPGVVTAIVLAEVAGAVVHCVESDKRKAAFLRTVARETGAPVRIHAERIETFVAGFDDPVDAVSARALAPLAKLLTYAEKFIAAGAVGVFPKGQGYEAELTECRSDRRFDIAAVPSGISDGASLLIVRTS